ncbi:Putative esterase [Pricia antarctica]|uniref:Putative esterase n=1 Tax=Pricia antarctica TaxID=641691 RepID=A0A1G7FR29_9FLAO|nr:alpha/beta hydrolase-fold protein [Pricia antarctica]SDE78282.1 Putative esterase [Pricia antarctica]
MKKICFSLLLIFLFALTSYGQQFKASYASSVFNKPFTGHVVVYMSKENKEPKNGMVGLESFPVFSVAVENIKAGEAITIDDKANSYPTVLSDIERGEYYVQIVWDRKLGGRSIAESSGNLFNPSEKITITKDTKKVFNINATQIIPELPHFKETEFVKELKAPSELLSKFHGIPMTVDAAVILPKKYYTEPKRKFPVLFTVSGYGGDYHGYSGSEKPSIEMDSVAVIQVFLDGNCSLGHSVYANSDNNGPWGDALTKEFIPLLEKNYRANGARLITGHSSGGWTVLWLQTQYPKVFDACWSSAPDPVDFRAFQQINIYEDKNAYYDEDGQQFLVATIAGRIPWASAKMAYQMENAVYRGEQMNSFDAVFSQKGVDGVPKRICNAETGKIDAAVVSHWKKYDIALNLKNNWNILKSELSGKVRISIGNQDNFLLNYAVMSLEKQMKAVNSTFKFGYYPGDHFTVWTPDYEKDGTQFLKQKYLEWLAASGAGKK